MARVRPATDNEKIERDRLCHSEWGAELTLAQFLDREIALRSHAWPKRALTTWLLEDSDGLVLASCETYEMRGSQGPIHGFASVFTEPALRGRGHASALVSEVNRGLPAAILFSEVGTRPYVKAGFVERESWERVFLPEPTTGASPSLTPLSREQALDRVPLLHPEAIVWPSRDQLDWHFERERVYARLLGAALPPSVGYTHADGSFILVSLSYKYRQLEALAFEARSPESAASLIRQTRADAHRLGLKMLKIWESECEVDWDRLGIPNERKDRPGTLAMISPDLPWYPISRSIWM